MSELKADQEPSIEEILESIRQIISEDGTPEAKPGAGAAKPEAAQPAAAPAASAAAAKPTKDVPLSLTPEAAAKPAESNLDLSKKPEAAAAATPSLDLSAKSEATAKPSNLDLSKKPEAAAASSNLDLSAKPEAAAKPASLDLSAKPEAAATDDVLDLTNMVTPPAAAAPQPAAPPQPTAPAAPAQPVATAPATDITIDMMDKPMEAPMTTNAPPSDTLVSQQAAQAATDSLSKLLAGNVAIEKDEVGRTGKVTLEDIAREMMMPIIKTWLDQNLPGIIERVVQKEVEKLARRAER